LDFSTLDARKHFCEEEVRLNSRLASDLYLGVVPIYGDEENPSFKGSGAPIEYAVKAFQFSQEDLLSSMQEKGKLTLQHMDILGETIARFHDQAAVAGKDTPFGDPEHLHRPVQQTFDQIRPLLQKASDRMQLELLEAWAGDNRARLYRLLLTRRDKGHIRECHGDIHLGNITQWNDNLVLFDCIEFNDDFRWIDTMSDIAFLVMDLEYKGQQHLANHLLNRYLEYSGDYLGLSILPYYKAYRAMVRAKVSLLRAQDKNLDESARQSLWNEYRQYAEMAEKYTAIPNSILLITHGISGTGKTTVTNRLIDELDVIRIRSDIERKRLYGLSPLDKSYSSPNAGIYDANSTDMTYNHMASLTAQLLSYGYNVAIDATFLKKCWRAKIQKLAEDMGIPYLILCCEASDQIILERIKKRHELSTDASEADEAVVTSQKSNLEPLSAEEKLFQKTIYTDNPNCLDELIGRIRHRMLA
jgi:aminoglycoside phosphotransferase family enzyme/gluconate kinase